MTEAAAREAAVGEAAVGAGALSLVEEAAYFFVDRVVAAAGPKGTSIVAAVGPKGTSVIADGGPKGTKCPRVKYNCV